MGNKKPFCFLQNNYDQLDEPAVPNEPPVPNEPAVPNEPLVPNQPATTNDGTACNNADDLVKVLELVESLKVKGNVLVSKADWHGAVEIYNEAIMLLPTQHGSIGPVLSILYANRSFAHLKLDNIDTALRDAQEAIRLNKDNFKGYYRAAKVFEKKGDFDEAAQQHYEAWRRQEHNNQLRIEFQNAVNEAKRRSTETRKPLNI